MFWGVTLMPDRRYTQTVEKSYHISMAAMQLAKDAKDNKRAQVMLIQNGVKFLLCNLDSDKQTQINLDLIFSEGEQVTFVLEGDSPVHLSGYMLDFDDELGDFDSSEEDDEDEEVIVADAKDAGAAKRKVNASPVEAKKLKVDNKPEQAKLNGDSKVAAKDQEDSEDDEDDDDFGLLDEGEDSDDLDDEEGDEESEEDEEDDGEDDEELEAPKAKVAAKPATNGQGKPQQKQQQQALKPKQGGGGGGGPQQQPNKFGGQGGQNKFGGQGGGNQNKFGGGNQKFGGGGGGNQNKFGGNRNNSPGGGFNKFGNKQGGGNQKFGGGGQRGSGAGGANKFGGNRNNSFKDGLRVDDLHQGAGPEAKKGKFVHVRYVGRLPNNKEFDRSAGKPFSFKLGAGQVIKGWDLGLEGMKVGGKRKITVPPQLGYGSKSMGPIPANSTLNFEVELVSVS